jgi:hypothetical protein
MIEKSSTASRAIRASTQSEGPGPGRAPSSAGAPAGCRSGRGADAFEISELIPLQPRPGERYVISAAIDGTQGTRRIPITLERGEDRWTSVSYRGVSAKLDPYKGNRFRIVVNGPTERETITGNVHFSSREIGIDQRRIKPLVPPRP